VNPAIPIKTGHSDQEEPALAELVAEPAADHEQDAHREHVGRSQPLDQTFTAVQVPRDRGRGDIGDR
jgi:hypothetical protein